MNSNNGRKILLAIIIIIILALMGFLAVNILGLLDGNKKPIVQNTDVSDAAPTEISAKNADVNTVNNPIDFKTLRKTNPEVVAWIYVPGTNIDYPIMQSLKSDDFYLHRDINGDYKYAGSIYMEYCNRDDFTDRVTVLYGHNMANGSMFAHLHKFANADFFKKHKKFYIYTDSRKLTYQIASGYVYDSRHIMNSFNFAENDVFEEYLNFIQNPRSATRNTRSKLDHKLTTDDRVVTLSTCLNSGDGRYLLQGVLTKDEFTR